MGGHSRAVREYVDVLLEYGLRSVSGDNYSAEWVQSAFKDHDIEYKRAELNKSALYLEALETMRGRLRAAP